MKMNQQEHFPLLNSFRIGNAYITFSSFSFFEIFSTPLPNNNNLPLGKSEHICIAWNIHCKFELFNSSP